jgi:hypothetical protein
MPRIAQSERRVRAWVGRSAQGLGCAVSILCEHLCVSICWGVVSSRCSATSLLLSTCSSLML